MKVIFFQAALLAAVNATSSHKAAQEPMDWLAQTATFVNYFYPDQ